VLPTATAALTADDGSSIELMPMLTEDGQALYSFQKPNIVLRSGAAYRVITTGLVDFGGNSGQGAAAVVVDTRAAPPLIPEDGFESVADGALGGSQVVSGAWWPVLAGTKSLYSPALFSGIGALPPYTPLALRIALAPGDQFVRFSYRVVAQSETTFVWGPTLTIGAPGSAAGAVMLASESGTFAPFQPANQATIYLGELKTAEIPIPAGSTGDLLIQRVESFTTCGLPPPPAAGIIIDNLRAE
jgi:hypothetical protein